MMIKKSITDRKKKIALAFSEVKKNKPSIVKKTEMKKGKVAGRKQKIAIALSKARQMGAKIPMKNK